MPWALKADFEQPTESFRLLVKYQQGEFYSMSRRTQYYATDDDPAALIRAYAYLIRVDCRWLANMPGIDSKRLRETYKAQQRGEVWNVQDLIDMARKPVIVFPGESAQQVAA